MMNKYKHIISIVFFLFGCSQFTQAQKLDPKISSLFVYSFTKYIEWPNVNTDNNFVIGVMGNSAIFNELQKIALTKKVGTRSITVKNISVNAAEEAKKCHILIISDDESSKFKTILEEIHNSPVLLVTEKKGLAHKGAAISLFLDDNDEYKTKFELNKEVLHNSGLKVQVNLLALAVLVK